jgi:hypothetical protein
MLFERHLLGCCLKGTCLDALDHGQYLKRPRRIAIAVLASFSMYWTMQYDSCWW